MFVAGTQDGAKNRRQASGPCFWPLLAFDLDGYGGAVLEAGVDGEDGVGA